MTTTSITTTTTATATATGDERLLILLRRRCPSPPARDDAGIVVRGRAGFNEDVCALFASRQSNPKNIEVRVKQEEGAPTTHDANHGGYNDDGRRKMLSTPRRRRRFILLFRPLLVDWPGWNQVHRPCADLRSAVPTSRDTSSHLPPPTWQHRSRMRK